MKILDTPRSGKCGQTIAFQSRFGLCLRQHVPQKDIMVFGQEPCSLGRYQRRNVSYLGLLPPPIGDVSEITALYRAKFGQPRPDQKIFIVTCQEKDGWKGLDLETSATVPERPMDLQATAETSTSHPVYMHTGCTADADGTGAPAVSSYQDSKRIGTGDSGALGAPLEANRASREDGDAPA